MPKIMFFAHDPGGANAVFPLIESLSKRNEVFIFADGPAMSKLPKSQELQYDTLQTIMPDFLITGTSANDFTEKHLWLEAEKLNIKSMAILDSWINYGIRFSEYGLQNIDQFDKNCIFLPSYICVMDEFSKKEMIKDGVPSERIFSFGNPHFENFIIQSHRIPNIKKEYAKPDEILITFASEPYIEDYGNGLEICILEDLIDVTTNNDKIKILIKTHPKENISKYKDYESDRVMLGLNHSAAEIIKASDIVVGMTSTFLIEAMFLKKRIVNYQLNQTDKNEYILTKMDILPFINNKKDFKKEFNRILNDKESLDYNHNINLNSIKNITKFVERELCVSCR